MDGWMMVSRAVGVEGEWRGRLGSWGGGEGGGMSCFGRSLDG